jgi:Protein of unknown function (DUF1761)
MTFGGINYIAVLLAAVAAWLAGTAWYMALGRTWAAALGTTAEEMAKRRAEPGGFLPFIYVLLAEVVMAWVLGGVLGHLGPGQVTLRNGIISGAFCWSGFVITSMWVNNSFAGRDWRLILIDGGHWLLVLVLIGAVIGAMGV